MYEVKGNEIWYVAAHTGERCLFLTINPRPVFDWEYTAEKHANDLCEFLNEHSWTP
jgi:hypothetical protein